MPRLLRVLQTLSHHLRSWGSDDGDVLRSVRESVRAVREGVREVPEGRKVRRLREDVSRMHESLHGMLQELIPSHEMFPA